MARKKNNKLVLVALLATAGCALGAGVAAQFTETASTAGENTAGAATGKMVLGGAIDAGFTVADLVPGDTVTRDLTVLNDVDGAGAGYAWESATLDLDYLNSVAGVGGTAFEQGPAPLTVKIIDAGVDGVFGNADDRVVSGTATVGDQSGLNLMRGAKDRWMPSESRTFRVALTFPSSATNVYEGASAQFAYTVNAAQRHGAEAGTFDATGNITSEVDNFDSAANVVAP